MYFISVEVFYENKKKRGGGRQNHSKKQKQKKTILCNHQYQMRMEDLASSYF